jgi:geranylgeranylglycerol-phosphate geranylgeranyltransferase
VKLVKKIAAYGQLGRLPNVGIAAFTGLVAFSFSQPLRVWKISSVLFALLAIALMCLGGNVINDFFDIEIDRINRPDRPLPSGRVSRPAALVMALAAFLSGLTLSFFLGMMTFMVGVLAVLLLVIYAAWLKRVLIIGNVAVAFISALTFLYVGAVYKNPFHPLIVFPALFIFLFHFGREIIKDEIDMEGDSRLGARTIPIVFGRNRASVVAAIPFLMLIPLTIVPSILKIYDIFYLVLVIAAVDTVLVWVIVKLFSHPTDQTLKLINSVLKRDMLFGLIALNAGSRWWFTH